jgi:hypothetical protein
MSSADISAAAMASPAGDNGVFKFVGGLVLGFVLRSVGGYLLEQVRGTTAGTKALLAVAAGVLGGADGSIVLPLCQTPA